MTRPYVTDLGGQAQPWLWLLETFGHIAYHPAVPKHDRPLYRITRLQAGTTRAALSARVIDEEGRPVPRVRIVRVWSQSPLMGSRTVTWDGEAPAPRAEVPEEARSSALGDTFAVTDADGVAEFGTGPDDIYQLPGAGRSSLWVADPGVPSDALQGVGILRTPEGRRLGLHITWQRQRPPRAIQPARWLHPSLARAKTRAPAPAHSTRGHPAHSTRGHPARSTRGHPAHSTRGYPTQRAP